MKDVPELLSEAEQLSDRMKQIWVRNNITSPDLSKLSASDLLEWLSLENRYRLISAGLCEMVKK